jgi:predicted transcriptional regulator YheO
MKKSLQPYLHIADAISQLFYPYAEVVIHDLETCKIAYLANNYSNRKIGNDSLIEEASDIDSFPNVFTPYFKTNWDGRRLKSTTVTIRDENGRPAGLLCINVDISHFDACQKAISIFTGGVSGQIPETLFRDDWREKISIYVNKFLLEKNLTPVTLTKAQRQQLIENLFHDGAFKAKKGADYVASVLGVSRATVYNHMSQIKKKLQPM